jgi:hypothetical protein
MRDDRDTEGDLLTMSDMITREFPLTRHIGEMLVFPIVKALFYPDGTETHKLIGTGFFFGSKGQFFSARRVFLGNGSATDLEGASGLSVYCVHTVDLTRRPAARYVDLGSIRTRYDTDIAIGLVEPNQFGKPNPSIKPAELVRTAHFSRFTDRPVQVGTAVYTIAYPLTTVASVAPRHVHIDAWSDTCSGRITRWYPNGRDAGFLWWPCYETDMEIKGGASGGPVIIAGSGGVVFAVNCAGTLPHSFSHVSSLTPLADSGIKLDARTNSRGQ